MDAKLGETRPGRDAFIAEVCRQLTARLAQQGFAAVVSGRTKHGYSIWTKMQDRQCEFEHVHDRVAFQVQVETAADCYAALGVIHSMWTPVPGRFKDYLALPKPNMYQALHTTVFGLGNQRIEIQIRTHDMHRTAEQGVVAHWRHNDAISGGVESRRRTLRLAAPAGGFPDRAQGPGGVPGERQGRPVPRRGLRVHPQG